MRYVDGWWWRRSRGRAAARGEPILHAGGRVSNGSRQQGHAVEGGRTLVGDVGRVLRVGAISFRSLRESRGRAEAGREPVLNWGLRQGGHTGEGHVGAGAGAVLQGLRGAVRFRGSGL